MPNTGLTDQPVTDTPEGWAADDLSYYRFVVGRASPRSGSYLRQLKADVESWQALAYWGAGVVTIAAGLASGLWPFALVGAGWLCVLLWLFIGAARALRHGLLLRGVVRSLTPHPLLLGHSTAEAHLPDGRRVLVGLTTSSAAGLIERHGQVEVLTLLDPKGGQGGVIGVRAVADREADSTPPL